MKKKWLHRIARSFIIAIALVLCIASLVMAAPSNITVLTGTATSTSVYLIWVKASASTSTVIRYSTTTYPPTPADGSSAYNGTASYTTITGLTTGATYYFSAWGYDGAAYSPTAKTFQITTPPVAAENVTIPLPLPSIPSEAWQTSNVSTWNIHPLDYIIEWFADPSYTHGGLGMPTENVITFMFTGAITGVGLLSYVKWRNFFTAMFIVIVLTIFGVTVQVIQGWVIVMEILIALGVFAIEHNFQ